MPRSNDQLTEAGIEEPLEVFVEGSDTVSSRNRGGSDGRERIDLRDGLEVELVVWCTLKDEG